jgi:DNA polymerase III subunit beta
MQITAVADFPGKDGQATTVGARKLQDLLRALPDDAQVNVDASGSKMTVKAGLENRWVANCRCPLARSPPLK